MSAAAVIVLLFGCCSVSSLGGNEDTQQQGVHSDSFHSFNEILKRFLDEECVKRNRQQALAAHGALERLFGEFPATIKKDIRPLLEFVVNVLEDEGRKDVLALVVVKVKQHAEEFGPDVLAFMRYLVHKMVPAFFNRHKKYADKFASVITEFVENMVNEDTNEYDLQEMFDELKAYHSHLRETFLKEENATIEAFVKTLAPKLERLVGDIAPFYGYLDPWVTKGVQILIPTLRKLGRHALEHFLTHKKELIQFIVEVNNLVEECDEAGDTAGTNIVITMLNELKEASQQIEL